MLRDFVEKLKSTTTSGSHEADRAPEQSSPSPAPAFVAIPQLAPPASQSASSHSVLGPDVEVKGSIRFSRPLVIDGRVEGDVCSDSILTVGAHAVIKGEIKTRSAIIFGQVEGNISTQERCELKSTATLVGDIAAGSLTIEEGAAFTGQSQVGKRQSAIKKTPDHAAKPLEVLQGTKSDETPAQPAAVIPSRQAA